MNRLKAIPYLLCGIAMVTLSREHAIKYGMLLIGASLIYMWLASSFKKEEVQ